MRPRLAMTLNLVMITAACTYKKAKSYEDVSLVSDLTWQPSLNADSETHQMVGYARADEKGTIFNHCDYLVQRATYTIADDARALGGDTVGQQVWFPKDKETYDAPRCKKRWAFFLFPPLVFTPWFMSATVEAKIFKHK